MFEIFSQQTQRVNSGMHMAYCRKTRRTCQLTRYSSTRNHNLVMSTRSFLENWTHIQSGIGVTYICLFNHSGARKNYLCWLVNVGCHTKWCIFVIMNWCVINGIPVYTITSIYPSWYGSINTYENTIFRGLFTSILTQLWLDVNKKGYYWFWHTAISWKKKHLIIKVSIYPHATRQYNPF